MSKSKKPTAAIDMSGEVISKLIICRYPDVVLKNRTRWYFISLYCALGAVEAAARRIYRLGTYHGR